MSADSVFIVNWHGSDLEAIQALAARFFQSVYYVVTGTLLVVLVYAGIVGILP